MVAALMSEARSAENSSRARRESLRSWYSDEFRLRVVRAVSEGRADAERAADLHRLMAALLDAHFRTQPEVQADTQVDETS